VGYSGRRKEAKGSRTMPSKLKQVSVRVTDEQEAWLRSEASRLGVSLSVVLKMLIQAHIESIQNQSNKITKV